MFQPPQNDQPSHDHATFSRCHAASPSHQEHSSGPCKIKCSFHQQVPVSSRLEFQRVDHQSKSSLRSHQAVPNQGPCLAGSNPRDLRIGCPATALCSCCQYPPWGSDRVIEIEHLIVSFLIWADGPI